MNLNTKQRRDEILGQLYESGRIEVRQLSSQMGISEATLRRDLRSLAEERQLELVYGGATLPRSNDFSFRSKSLRNPEEKRIIGRLAAEHVKDGDTIFMDSGTTCFEMCPYLKRKRGLSIIVNSIRLAAEFSAANPANLIVIGGQYRPERLDMVGPLAMATLEQLRGYVAFIGADGVSMDCGVTASDIDSAHLHKLAIQNAREAILLIDHSKLYVPSLYKITDISAIRWVVTDREPVTEWIKFFCENGIDVLCPPDASNVEIANRLTARTGTENAV